MFREFNIKFEDVEMIEGADNLLEGTEVTKVIMRGDNKMSSLNSAFRNCLELDTIDGEIDLNGVSNIDDLLYGTNLVKRINLKNINNENISANNSFPSIEEINIGGKLYNKKAIQNVIASKDWNFDNINYTGILNSKVFTETANTEGGNNVVIKDSLEQKATEIEVIGETLENLINGRDEKKLTGEINEYHINSYDELHTFLEEYQILEFYGDSHQDRHNLSNIYSVGNLYINEEGEPILDEDGHEQYIIKIISKNTSFGKGGRL